MQQHDVVIVGSGPAGVSAAFALLAKGLRILLVDGGRDASTPPPGERYLQQRFADATQWKWMVGQDFHAIRHARAASPKLRVPGYGYVFEGFAEHNAIEAHDFVALGSLARGGLSNAWGCGVAKWLPKELEDFPFPATDLDASYAAVARRMGISGAQPDDMEGYFSVDEWAGPPVPLDILQSALLEKYSASREMLLGQGFRLGRSRVAVLTESRADRDACDRLGNCLWGCARGALYSAAQDLATLRRQPGFDYLPGFVVAEVDGGDRPGIHGVGPAGPATHRAKRVLLAAGTLGSSRLALRALPQVSQLEIHSSPTAAFLLWMPRQLGQPMGPAFGLGQLSFALNVSPDIRAFGSLFNPQGIPLVEFVRHAPLGKSVAIDILGTLLKSCVVGNVFLPSRSPRGRMSLTEHGTLRIDGVQDEEVQRWMTVVQRNLGKHFRRLGAYLLPTSFTIGAKGSDIHYAGTLPMRRRPNAGETDRYGELAGLSGVHIIDGACLPTLTEKSHTMTIMANADRIGAHVARLLS